jgi:hypothetical protein
MCSNSLFLPDMFLQIKKKMPFAQESQNLHQKPFYTWNTLAKNFLAL